MKKSFCAFAAALSMTVSAASGFQPTGLNRDAYLDLMEPIVRLAAGWVDEKGAVIDPALNREWNQTTPRFVSSAAILLRFGRCPELLDTVRRAMTYSCSRLPETEVRESSPDFWMRELATAWCCLKPLVPPEESEAWRARLAAVEPENIYKFTDPAHKKLKEFHNWAVYSSGGESMRDSLGIGGGDFLWGNRFFDVYMAGQLHRLTPEGMYRDPGDPITYDITTRLQIANALHFGYRGEHFRILDNFLKTGGPTLLRFLSPEGFVPYGGRSAGMQFQEAIAAALCELEANRCKRLGDLESAGQFKRQAHLCIQAIRPYLTGRELYHVKNRFPPTSLHGCDGYAQYSVYLLFASSVLGQAALFADDSIAERPAPAEQGGYLFVLAPAFHKVFASCGGSYAELDADADPRYDSTGLGRILLKGVPYGVLPAMPFTATPNHKLTRGKAPAQPVAIGPAWEGGTAAAKPDAPWDTEIIRQTPQEVAWKCAGKYGEHTVIQEYALTPAALAIRCRVTGKDGKPVPFRFEFPVLSNDGALRPEWKLDGNVASYENIKLTASAPWQAGEEIANRNGLYRVLRFDSNAEGVAEVAAAVSPETH